MKKTKQNSLLSQFEKKLKSSTIAGKEATDKAIEDINKKPKPLSNLELELQKLKEENEKLKKSKSSFDPKLLERFNHCLRLNGIENDKIIEIIKEARKFNIRIKFPMAFRMVLNHYKGGMDFVKEYNECKKMSTKPKINENNNIVEYHFK